MDNLKCNLYRTIKEILHPTISKRNISNYKIIINDELLPLRIFYPTKVTNIENIMIYIKGVEEITSSSDEYRLILRKAAVDYNQLIISIVYEDYDNLYLLDLYEKIFETIKYIYNELINNGIKKRNITLAGDSIGASAVLSTVNHLLKEDIKIKKQILFYPLVSGEYFKKSILASIKDASPENQHLIKKIASFYERKTRYKKDLKNEELFALLKDDFTDYPKTLIICGNADFLIDEAKILKKRLEKKAILVEVPFEYHGFLKNNNLDTIRDYQIKIKKFLQ